MIGRLKGILLSIDEETVLVDVSGVGYEVSIASREASALLNQLGQEVSFYIYTLVREDALQLFGFSSQWDKRFFIQLLKVSGVGPKLAMSMISSANPLDIYSWILNKDISSLKSLPKVGQKLAEQLVLGLNQALAKMPPPSGLSEVCGYSSVKADISSALMNLGFKNLEIQEVIKKINSEMSFEEGMKLSLQELRN